MYLDSLAKGKTKVAMVKFGDFETISSTLYVSHPMDYKTMYLFKTQQTGGDLQNQLIKTLNPGTYYL